MSSTRQSEKFTYIISAFALVILVNTASAAINITDADAIYEVNLSTVSIPISPVPIKTVFVINADTSLDRNLSPASIPTQSSPLKEIFIINEDAALKKNLFTVSIPTEPLPIREIFIHLEDAKYFEELLFSKELINDTTPPIISNITVTNITENSATIKWDTDEFADSLVKYGTSSGAYTKQEYDELFVKKHAVSLYNLSPGTKYYFVVKSVDLSGNSVESSEYSFTTTGVPNKPIISISTDKYEYTAGDTMSINITISNPTEEGQSVYFAWRLDLPDYDLQYWIMKKSLYLPPDYKRTFTIPFTLGDYRITFNASWYVALYNTTTLEVISEDTADWQYVSGAKARGKAIPEEIAKEIIKTAEIEEVELPN